MIVLSWVPTLMESECQPLFIWGWEFAAQVSTCPHLIHSLKANTSPLNIGHWPQKENSSDSTFINSQLFRGKKPSKNANANMPRRWCVLCQLFTWWIPRKAESSRTSHRENLSFSAVQRYPPDTIPYYKVRPPYYKVIRRVVSPLVGVITPFTTGRGPPCKNIMILLGDWYPESMILVEFFKINPAHLWIHKAFLNLSKSLYLSYKCHHVQSLSNKPPLKSHTNLPPSNFAGTPIGQWAPYCWIRYCWWNTLLLLWCEVGFAWVKNSQTTRDFPKNPPYS